MRWVLMIVFAIATVAGAFVAISKERQDSAAAKESERLALSRGGYPTVSVMGFMPIPEQTRNGRVLAQVRISNGSLIPVLNARTILSHFVGIGNGPGGSDNDIMQFPEVSAVNPNDMAHALHNAYMLKTDGPNKFNAFVTTRWGRFSEDIVVVWKDDAWQADTEVTQLEDKKLGNEKVILKEMRADLRALWPRGAPP